MSAESYRAGEMALTKLTPTLGAELNEGLFTEVFERSAGSELQKLLDEYGVLVVRNLSLSAEQQFELAQLFGEPLEQPHPKFGHVAGLPAVSEIINDEDNPPDINVWHTDTTYLDQPAKICLLFCEECPDVGGDTLWADCATMYQSLSPQIQTLLAGMKAIHALRLNGIPIDKIKALGDRQIEAVHPLVHRHPSGRACLYANSVYTREVLGLNKTESDAILGMLFRLAETPEYQCRVKWRPGTLVIWDNRRTQHYAVADYFPQRRVMRRVAISGEALNPWGE